MTHLPGERLHLTLLGPFALHAGREERRIRGSKVCALLAYLAVERDRMHPRESLMALFWPDLPLEQAQANLRQTTLRLRRALPQARLPDGAPADLILSDRLEIGITPDAGLAVDVARFRHLLHQVRTHRHETLARCAACRERLEEAVELYQGDFLEDLHLVDSNEFEEWAAANRQEVRQAMLQALDELATIYMAQGHFSRAEPVARRQIAIDPLREGAYRQLMTLLARSGRSAEALAVYESARRHLAEELGTDPSAATRALHTEILTGELEEEGLGGELSAYELGEEIAHGAFGVVYRAYQPAVGREVAVKVIRPEVAGNPDFARRLETEARIVARLEHPHIVPLYAFWRDESGTYLVMRLLHGGSLRDLLRQGPLEHERLLRLLDQITDALAAVHQHGVVHRDLKPGNILLDEMGNAYLTDFGLAKELVTDARQTASDGLLGSPAYVSPEQLRSEPVTPRSDIYSLGIVLYEMLAGELPFQGPNLAAVLQRQLNEPLPLLSEQDGGLPPAVDVVLARATAKQAEDRYPDVLSFAADLRQALTAGAAPPLEAVSQPPVLLYRERLPSAAAFPPPPPFVARREQLALLHERLARAQEGQGQVVCITGDAGRGKSALMAEFARQAMAENSDLLVAMGSCSTFSSSGDPYLPFRELLAVLTADVEARLRTGVVSPEHARRLWASLPATMRVLVEYGPDLVGSLLPAAPLLARARSAAPVDAPWLADLGALAGRQSADEGQDPAPNRFFSEVTGVLQALSEKAPLLLVLDDLQWIDNPSASLLFDLCRQLSGRRIVLAFAYRADEVAQGRDGARHPLAKVVSELRRLVGPAWIDLSELDAVEGRAFIDALLDGEPNRLDEDFRRALYAHTGGHPLFTLELLRSLQAGGQMARDDDGRWQAGAELDWRRLPPRVEGVIEERIARLPEALQRMLTTASVEGEVFTAQVVSRVEAADERQVWRTLSHELQDRHQLIREEEELRLGRTYLTRYRFQHRLFQQYLYDRLGSAERRLLHGDVGQNLEAVAGVAWERFAAELAWHFGEAGMREKALPYWLYLGDQARINYAQAEAQHFYESAVEELAAQGRQEEAARTLMKLGLVHTAAFQPQRAQQAYARAFTLWKPAPEEAHAVGGGPAARLRLALEAPSTLDPGLIDDDVSTFLAAQLFEGLVRIGQDHNVLPAAARRWEVLDDGTRYRFFLRDDLRWNDGRPLTAHDFVYAWRRNLRPQTASPSAHLLFAVTNAERFALGKLDDPAALGVQAEDDHTLLVTLVHPSAYLPYLLAHTVTFPQPQGVVKRWGATWTTAERLVNNGPFQLARAQDGRQLTLERNPYFQERFAGNVERVDCTIFRDYAAALDAYAADEVDVVNLFNASPDVIIEARARYGAQVLAVPRLSTFYVNLRCDRPPLDDRRVRQALAQAVDKRALVETVLKGLRQAATGGFVPQGMPGHSPGISLPFDARRARELLAEAGYAGGRGFPAVEWLSGPGGKEVIAFLQEAWSTHLGLDLEAQTLPFPALFKRLSEDPADLMLTGWGADFPDPANVLRTPFHCKGRHNYPRWCQEEFDRLTDLAERTSDNEERLELYRCADRILVAEETAVLHLTYAEGSVLVKPWVTSAVTPSIAMSLQFAMVARPG